MQAFAFVDGLWEKNNLQDYPVAVPLSFRLNGLNPADKQCISDFENGGSKFTQLLNVFKCNFLTMKSETPKFEGLL